MTLEECLEGMKAVYQKHFAEYMMKNVILETRDGWRKKMVVPAGERFVKVPVMSARDFALDTELSFDTARDASYRFMTFDWDGREEDEVTFDGDGYLLTVWEVWREV